MAENKQPGRNVSSEESVSSGGVCEVAVARTFLGTLAYSIPASLVGAVEPGVRVRVPLGGKTVVGVVDRLGLRADRARKPRLRELRGVLDEGPVIDTALLDLCRWIADYYVAPLGVVLRTALPPGALGARAASGGAPDPAPSASFGWCASCAR